MRSARTLLTLLLLSATGCVGYNLHVSLGDDYARSLGDDRVFVHIVPVNPHDRQQFENWSLEDYWQYSGTHHVIPRERDTKIFELSSTHPADLLSKDDPIWKAWKDRGVTTLMVLSNRPIPEHSAGGEEDPRRRFIPADYHAWTSRDVRISLTAGGLRVDTAQK